MPVRFLHPFSFSGQRGITPAFGYDAPSFEIGGTLTLLNLPLLSARDVWVGSSPDLKRLRSEPLVGTVLLQIERNGILFRVHGGVRSKKT